MVCDDDWQVFEGVAASKKQAMHAAASEALEVVEQQPASTSTSSYENETATSGVPTTKSSPESRVLALAGSGKNAVMIINEVYPRAEYSLESESGIGMTKSFVMSLSIDGQTFNGSGRSKRQAKAYAAQVALSELHGAVLFQSPGEFSCIAEC